MRINEYKSLDEFLSQYIGVWNPSEGHWLGLDFIYNNQEYRFHTGSMYGDTSNVNDEGVICQFGIYKRVDCDKEHSYELMFEAASIDEILESDVIDEKKFSDVIMDDTTELVGQD